MLTAEFIEMKSCKALGRLVRDVTDATCTFSNEVVVDFTKSVMVDRVLETQLQEKVVSVFAVKLNDTTLLKAFTTAVEISNKDSLRL